MQMKFLAIFAAALCISCVKKPFSPVLSLPQDLQALLVSENNEQEFSFMDEDESAEEENTVRRIIIPYAKEYLSLGQETRLMVYLENGDYGDEMDFSFTPEAGKNSIKVEGIYNAALIQAVREGEQYLEISHPKAPEARFILYDVLPSAPPPPPEIDVSESPLIIRKDQTRALRLSLLNGTAADSEKFRFQVVENAYAIEVKQHGSTLQVTGIAPGAGKIRITNPAALRDYDVMVIVD